MFRKKWFIAVYILALLALLVSFLIFFPKNEHINSEIPQIEISTDNTANDDNNESEPENSLKTDNDDNENVEDDDNTSNTDQEENPEDSSTNPEQPADTEENPIENPDNSSGEDNPDNSNESTNPETPSQPEIPENPNEPEENLTPNEPDNADEPNNPDSSEDEKNTENPSVSEKEKEDENIEYAESITLICARDIKIVNGGKAKLLDGFLKILPETITDYEIKIEPKSKDNIDGITLVDNIITANKVGFYTVYFSVAKSKSTYLKDYLVVEVVAELHDDKISQITSTCEINTNIKLKEMFEVNDIFTDIKILNSEEITYSEGYFNPLKVGKFDIEIYLINNFISYMYKFPITIKDKPNVSIEITLDEVQILNNSIIEKSIGEVFVLEYLIKDDNFEIAEQEISIEIYGDEVLELKSINSPMIFLKCIGKGSVTLSITSISTNTNFIVNLIFV